MSTPASDDVLAALRGFVARIDALDPAASGQRELTVRLGDLESRMTLRTPVAAALVEALRGYHDPRDRGGCDHCGGRRLDDNLLCLDCGQPNGLFGQLIVERAARHTEQTAVLAQPAGRGRHARDEDGETWDDRETWDDGEAGPAGLPAGPVAVEGVAAGPFQPPMADQPTP